jgi:tRNA A37 threonylcarbamoyladenosine modification protein TsaB
MKGKELKLKAELNHDFLLVSLEKEGRVIGKVKTSNDRTISQKLLPLLDKFLKKNKVSTEDIKDIKLKSKLPDSFTSYRIVKVVLETIKWNRITRNVRKSNG